VQLMVLGKLVRLSTARSEEEQREVGPFSRASREFSMKFVGKEKPDIHYPVFIQLGENKKINTLACISSSYLLLILPCLCTLVNIFTPSAITGNGATNACWHFLASSLGVVSS